MTEPVLVDIGVACSGFQTHAWWSRVMAYLLLENEKKYVRIGKIFAVSSAVPDHAKSNAVGKPLFANPEEKRRNDLTDANRITIVGANVRNAPIEGMFWDSGAEYLMFLDDDTVPPKGFLSHLVNLKRPFVAGLYFLAQEPYNPVAFIKRDDGLYHAFYNYPLGALSQVDSVGMGCTLIHRSVFETIMANHKVFQRPDGSIFPVHKDKIKNDWPAKSHNDYVKNGYYHMPLRELEPDDNRAWPFFVLEYGRTEDHYFCELAASVGFRPWLDTTLVCDHIKPRGFGRAEYLEELNKRMRDETA